MSAIFLVFFGGGRVGGAKGGLTLSDLDSDEGAALGSMACLRDLRY